MGQQHIKIPFYLIKKYFNLLFCYFYARGIIAFFELFQQQDLIHGAKIAGIHTDEIN